jgi:hypothetical protein
LKNDTIEHARKIVAELESKLATASDRATALATDRRRLAYAAGVGDKPAAKKLAELTGESAVVGIEVENAHIALDEARHRLASAEHAAAIAEQKAAAERLRAEVRETAARVETRGPAISTALAAFCAEYASLESDLTALRQLGVEIAPARSVGLSFEAVLSHSVRSVGLHVGDLVEPGRRHSPEFLTDSYASRARTWGDAALNEKAAA